ncbi:uncharacterized protein LOC134220850 isoform X2 [Armigeres subalbatus]|uniref:uncharacterized protein LOC134220850 isoform X2 n=1 Tax=Armigeres subalbatus TaxID=124917 RepID=UPI002ED31A85
MYEKMVVTLHPPSPAQSDMLNELIKAIRAFLYAYDSIVLHKELYRSLFMFTLNNLREMVLELLLRFSTLPEKDNKSKEIECCGYFFNKYDACKDHYDHVHNKKTMQAASLCELKMSLTKITFFERRVRGYLKAGEISSCEMVLLLKKVVQNIDNTLEF